MAKAEDRTGLYLVATGLFALAWAYLLFFVVAAGLKAKLLHTAMWLLFLFFIAVPPVVVFRRWHDARARGESLFPDEYRERFRIGRKIGMALLALGYFCIGILFLSSVAQKPVALFQFWSGFGAFVLFGAAIVTTEISVWWWRASKMRKSP